MEIRYTQTHPIERNNCVAKLRGYAALYWLCCWQRVAWSVALLCYAALCYWQRVTSSVALLCYAALCCWQRVASSVALLRCATGNSYRVCNSRSRVHTHMGMTRIGTLFLRRRFGTWVGSVEFSTCCYTVMFESLGTRNFGRHLARGILVVCLLKFDQVSCIWILLFFPTWLFFILKWMRGHQFKRTLNLSVHSMFYPR